MKRTDQQNKALHKYFELLAEALNDAGFETKAVLAVKEVDVPWNKELVKELLWRPIQKTMTGQESTTKISRVEPSDIYMVLDRHISEKFGVHIEWPAIESN